MHSEDVMHRRGAWSPWMLLGSAALAVVAACAAPASSGEGPFVARAFLASAAPTAATHASTIVETSRGTLVAAWFGGTAESRPDVGIWVARRDEGAWSDAREVVQGDDGAGHRLPCWNPVLFEPRGGPLQLFYKVGPSPSRWWGMVMASTDDGRSWSPARRLPDGVLGPIKNKPLQLADGTIVCGSSTEDPRDGWRVHVELSTDAFQTCTVVGPLADPERLEAIQPTLLQHADGSLQMLCRTKARELGTAWSHDGGRSWSALQRTGLLAANSGIDAVTLPDGTHVLAFNPRAAPTVTAGETERCPLTLARSVDGVRWRRVLDLEDVPCAHGYAYPALIVDRAGRLQCTYTWNRTDIRWNVLDPQRLSDG